MAIRDPRVVERVYSSRVTHEMSGGEALAVTLPKELEEEEGNLYSRDTKWRPRLRIDNKTGERELVLIPKDDE